MNVAYSMDCMDYKERRNCGTCRWYDPLEDCCERPGGPCKEPKRERWECEIFKFAKTRDEQEDGTRYRDAIKTAISALLAQQTPAKLDRSRWKGCEH